MVVTPHRTLAVHTARVRVIRILWAHPGVLWHMSALVLQDKVLGPEGILEGIPGEMALSLDHEELAPFLSFFKHA